MSRIRFVFVVFLTVIISAGVCRTAEAKYEAQVRKFTVTIDVERLNLPPWSVSLYKLAIKK